MGRSMSRLCHKVKISEVWPEHTRTRAVNPPDSATSPGTPPQVWASASRPWKVTLFVLITEIRCLTEPLRWSSVLFSGSACFCTAGERGHFSVSLVSGGAAEEAGVCKGDRLVWMNGATVCELTHSALNRMVVKVFL